MHRIRIWADIDDDVYRAIEGEAERRGVSIESLVEHAVNSILREDAHAAREGLDHPITTR